MEKDLLSKYPLEILSGKKNLEVRPKAVNKGEIVRNILTQSKKSQIDFCFCAGDDRTDEDMFKALKDCNAEDDIKVIITCSIGPSNKNTSADWYLTSPKELFDLISKLAS